MGGLGQTEADIVVSVRAGVPVPVGGTQVPRFVVPGAAPNHALASRRPVPLLKVTWLNIVSLNAIVSA